MDGGWEGGRNSFLLELAPIEKGGKNESGRVVLHEGLSSHLKKV